MRAVNKRKPPGPNSLAQFWQLPLFCKSIRQQADDARALACLWNTREGTARLCANSNYREEWGRRVMPPLVQYSNTFQLLLCKYSFSNSAPEVLPSSRNSCCRAVHWQWPCSRVQGNCGHSKSNCCALNTCTDLRQVLPGCFIWHMENPPLELSRSHIQLEPDSSINTE